jgi:hypothetical protein
MGFNFVSELLDEVKSILETDDEFDCSKDCSGDTVSSVIDVGIEGVEVDTGWCAGWATNVSIFRRSISSC